MKEVKRKSIVLLSVMFLVMSLTTGFAGGNNHLAEVQSINLITEVKPLGEQVVAVAIEYNVVIDSRALEATNFVVKNRNNEISITNIYANNEPAITNKTRNGKFVIIQFDENDSNAGTLVYNAASGINTRTNVNYSIIQIEDITQVNGRKIDASNDPMSPTGEINLIVNRFEKLSYTDEETNYTLNYRFFKPNKAHGKKLPLVLFLHGAGERGSNNDVQILANEGAVVWASPENQKENPAYVLAAQVPVGGGWSGNIYEALLKLIDETVDEYRIDTDRIYITGMSMGGIGTWNMIQKNPDLFAAAIPICGIGNPANAEVIKDMPIWITHEDGDFLDVQHSRDMYSALLSAGSEKVIYTEYPFGTSPVNPHFSWVPTYQNQEIIDWLFQQSK